MKSSAQPISQSVQKTELKLIKRDSSAFKIKIPSDVEQKIRFICNRIWDNEWSGVLFYSVEGSFSNNNLVITCKDICLMDIGSSAFTEFENSPDIASFMVNHDLTDYQMGLIHSHDTMATFFSGTDTNTLAEEGMDRVHFVSLIVNDAGTYSAAITRRVTIESVIHDSFSYSTFGGISVSLGKSSKPRLVKQEVIEWYPLEVEKEEFAEPESELSSRIEEIKKTNEKTTATKYPYSGFNSQFKYGDYPDDDDDGGNLFSQTTDVNDNVKEEIKKKISPEYDKYSTDINEFQRVMKCILTDNLNLLEYAKPKSYDELAKKMSSLLKDKYINIKAYNNHIEKFISILLCSISDSALANQGITDMDEIVSIYAYKLSKYLKKCPSNPYIKICLIELDSYIV
jgi:proteasome lid subunit RPN8/RPN11